MTIAPPSLRAFPELFALDPRVTFLNHGSFGACPRRVIEAQRAIQDELEAEPVRFLGRELEGRLDHARSVLGAFLGADAEGLAFVENATTGVNTVLRSLDLTPGDELVVTDHGYAACTNAARVVAERVGARVVVAPVPFPITGPDAVVAAIVAALGPKTKLVLVDHVTSPTGLVFPVDRIIAECAARGIDVLVDGAHAPGMVPLSLDRLRAAYYTGNCHKWLCTPKGSAFLWVREDRRSMIRPLVISHGAASKRTDRARFRLEHDWVGTQDASRYLAIPAALDVLGAVLPGGITAVMASNRAKALAARAILTKALGVDAPAPEEMIGTLVALPLPDSTGAAPKSPWFQDVLAEQLFEAHGIEVPVYPFPRAPKRLVRIAAQLYNSIEQYERLAEALGTLLPRA
ncbi:aminotransferase class V-fold PLP-dependent enzyme [Myxococcota bacterium]|nr:aminotransferase class V-fold PLP-dependent enzyme [Myxococcota bacterium]